MAEIQQSLAPRGLIHFSPDNDIEPQRQGFLEPRRVRPQILRIGAPRDLTDFIPFSRAKKRKKTSSEGKSYGLAKLATSRETVKRVLRLSKFGPSLLDWERSTGSNLNTALADNSSTSIASTRAQDPTDSNMLLQRRTSPESMLTTGSSITESSGSTNAPTSSQSHGTVTEVGKPVATGNGVSVSINLAEPVLFLQGFDASDFDERTTTMLRGNLRLRVTKAAKIKAVTLKFKGKADTEWPEGIPPKKVDYKSSESLINHTWTFFNATFNLPESTHGADTVLPLKVPTTSTREISPNGKTIDHQTQLTRRREQLTNKDMRRLSLQEAQSRSFSKSDTNLSQKNYRLFNPGDYIYNFELPIDSRLPETIDVELGNVKYDLEAVVERAGAFRANLVGSKEVTMIRAPTEGSLETIEPIAISRDWEDQLHYDIVISGKSFPLGSQVPIAFKLTPLAKVRCHRIKVYITENIQYFTSNKRVHRLEPTRRIQLFEKRADSASTSTFPGSSFRILAGGGVDFDGRAAAAAGDESAVNEPTNILGRLEGENSNVGPTEIEMSVQLPSCQQMAGKEKSARIHFDTTYSNIQVHHWIKIVMRLSRPDAEDPKKQRHFEISIDSPFHILSCRATQANMCLPAYSAPESGNLGNGYAECGCPDAIKRRGTDSTTGSLVSPIRTSSTDSSDSSGLIAPPAAAHTHDQVTGLSRPMHLLRAPSFNPPPWSDDDLPPPLVTPPPQYENAIDGDPRDALADYFARLADEVDDDDTGVAGRLDMPLTPGGRVNRSMDARRTWLPVGSAFTG